ncbi:MAG: aromatic ring-hydroxylating dioxygenase subunit alpha [Azospirillaceae bacterium]|nr:aromatic ring-hydroxylating dioxygenase subunit alpha [Azospirillaceae bacterium]
MYDLNRVKSLLQQRRPGHSLPQALYNDADIFDFDMAAIFLRSWLMVGFEVELPDPGSYLSLTIGKSPVVILRDRDGIIRGFHNSCRHRGAQICATGRGKAARLVCPYHQWTYDLAGRLVYAGRMPETFDRTPHSLGPIHVETVAGTIYICLAAEPPPFDAFRDKLTPLLAVHDLRHAKLAFESTLVEKANWKLVMENGRECYHCVAGHPELSRSFPTGAKAHFEPDEAGQVDRFNDRMARAGLPVGPVEGEWWQAIRFPLNEGYVSLSVDGRPLVAKPMCPAEGGDIGSLRWAVEPNNFNHALGDHTFMFTALPVGPEETIVTAKWLVHQDAVEGVDYDLAALTHLWTQTNLQDRDLAENNQRGVHSIGYRPGPYSDDAESLARRFVDWYCSQSARFIDAHA